MKRIIRFLSAGLILAAPYSTGLAAEAPSFVQFVRPLGMGGAFTAVADDHNTFFFNPAGMVQRTGGQFTLLELAGGFSEDAKKLKDYIDTNKDDITNFDHLPASRQEQIINDIDNTISKLNSRVYGAADVASYVSGPHFMGMPLHVGFGAFAMADATAKLELSDAKIPEISYAVNGDAVLPLSIAHRWNAPWKIPGRFAFGATGKFLRRAQVKQDRVSTILLDNLDVPPAAIGHGFGSDLGFLYQPSNRTNFGVMVQDFLGTKIKYDAQAAKDGFPAVDAHNSVIRPRTNFGLALMPAKLLWLVPTGERLTLSADVRDAFAEDQHILFQNGFKKVIGENLGTHLHLGAELRYWFLRFRAGAYQGYPSFGLGLDIPILKIDYAYYSRELGPLAGDLREGNHVISVAFRFGSGSTESRERILKSKENGKMMNQSAPESESSSDAAPK